MKARRLIKSPFFYCAICGLFALTASVVWLAGPASSQMSVQRNIFDSFQYLFPDQGKVPVNFDLAISANAFLQPSAPPFMVKGQVLASAGGIIEPKEEKEVVEYIVEEGETLSLIAEKFDISLETILWANNVSKSSQLKIGQKLTILPISGLLHVVRERDTVSEIAELYKAKQADIIEFNDLGEDAKIYAGDFMIIPYGKKPKAAAQYQQVPLSQSYFICPIPSPCRVTQGLHWYNAIDFSNGKCGEPVFAAAGGVVQRVGYTNQGGNYVRIQHPNGVVTYYGHLSRYTVSAGAKVYQGQIIGYIGYTGHTIPAGPAGCHAHFDVRFAANPFARFSAGDKVAK